MDIIEIEPDSIDIDDITLSTFKDIEDIDVSEPKPSVNFGSGIELLMNDKQRGQKQEKANIDIDDIVNLENDLNDLNNVDVITKNDSNNNTIKKIDNTHDKITIEDDSNYKKINTTLPDKAKKGIFSNLFGKSSDGDNVKPVSDVGSASASINDNKTYDGYGKFNNIPLNKQEDFEKPLTPEEILKKKFEYLKKLESLEKKGAVLSQRYTMDSKLEEMIGEYETLVSERERQNSVKFQGKMLMACITGIEFLNNKFDPFDVKLEGWAEQINENIDDYDEIFGELHEKYKSKAKMTPELKLLFQLGGSAMMVHMSNTLFKSSMPGMDDIMRQNPELMRQFSQAAVNTMGQSNPGFGNFMGDIFNRGENGSASAMGFGNPNQDRRPAPSNVNIGPLPPSVSTQLPERSKREPDISRRPDIINARQGVSIDNPEGDFKQEERISRPEMKGPSQQTSKSMQNEINNLLSGIKTRQINVNDKDNEASTISIEDMKDLTGIKSGKSKRRQKSDKSTISLDI